jgi:hypothetical protein
MAGISASARRRASAGSPRAISRAASTSAAAVFVAANDRRSSSRPTAGYDQTAVVRACRDVFEDMWKLAEPFAEYRPD